MEKRAGFYFCDDDGIRLRVEEGNSGVVLTTYALGGDELDAICINVESADDIAAAIKAVARAWRKRKEGN
jgi:hypothetical protein